MKNKIALLVGLGLLFSCGSLEDRIAEDMKEHCECISEKGFEDSECQEIMHSIALKYQDEEGARDLIREESIKCGEQMMKDGKNDASIRVR
ncbi:MAG: hypothetical protein R2799_01265 [Crocinitomicaceae bacterium]|nr:hypothetical protein [Crocinitomicaceae bacterium]